MNYTVDFVFSKKGAMRFISHLDLMRLLTRAFRRAALPVKMTQGFNPHPRLSMKRALKLGVESDHEEASVVLTRRMDEQEFTTKLQRQLPEGIEVKHAKGNFN